MTEEERKILWTEYKFSNSYENREKLIIEYSPLVKIVAGRLCMYMGYNVEFDDLVGYGILGLIDAIDKFNLSKNIKFETYASLRIRGTIIDEIRKIDWIPRTLRQKQKKIDVAIKKIEEKNSNASDSEIANEIGIEEQELCKWQSQLKIKNIISLNEFVDKSGEIPSGYTTNSPYYNPEENINNKELKDKLEETLELLTKKEKSVIELYYYEELTLKEISFILNVSEPRISQIHTKALSKMRGKMEKYMEILNYQ